MKKICSKCKVKQQTTEFYKKSGRGGGLTSQCRTCILANLARYHAKIIENVIYMVVCPKGEFYIGSTKQGILRLKEHFKTRESNTKGKTLAQFLKKNNYKRKDIEWKVLEKFPPGQEKKMRARECEVIKEHIDNPLCINKENTLYSGEWAD